MWVVKRVGFVFKKRTKGSKIEWREVVTGFDMRNAPTRQFIIELYQTEDKSSISVRGICSDFISKMSKYNPYGVFIYKRDYVLKADNSHVYRDEMTVLPVSLRSVEFLSFVDSVGVVTSDEVPELTIFYDDLQNMANKPDFDALDAEMTMFSVDNRSNEYSTYMPLFEILASNACVWLGDIPFFLRDIYDGVVSAYTVRFCDSHNARQRLAKEFALRGRR